MTFVFFLSCWGAQLILEPSWMVYSLGPSWTQFDVLFGWNRDAVKRGLFEQRIGREIRSISSSRDRFRVETTNKDLLSTAQNLLDEQSQADPKFQSAKIYTRITGDSFRKALADSSDDSLVWKLKVSVTKARFSIGSGLN